MMNSKRLLLSVLAGMISACDTLKSTTDPVESISSGKPHVGNYYFLPRAVVQIDGAPISETGEFQVTIKAQNVPDKRYRFFLHHTTNVFYDDDLQIKVNSKGLLETVNATTEDKTPAIVDKITETFIDVAKIASAGPGSFFRDAKSIETAKVLKPFHVAFDPLDPQQRQAAIDVLKDCNFNLSFPSPENAIAQVASDTKEVARSVGASVSSSPSIPPNITGAVYRPPTAVEIVVSTLDNSQTGLLQHVWIRVPDPNSYAVVDTSRSFLIKKKNNYVMVDGDLTQVDHNRPSQALALVSIPASIAHKVSEAIPTLINLQDNRAKRVPPDVIAQQTQLDAQTALLNSKAALIEAEKKLYTAQNPPVPNSKALTREALRETAVAEKEEALARIDRARAEKERAKAESEKSKEEKEETAARAASKRAARERAPETPVPALPEPPSQ